MKVRVSKVILLAKNDMRQILICSLLLTLLVSYSQVREDKIFKAKLTGEKYLKGLEKEVTLSNFTIYFQTSDWAATGTVNSGLGAAAYLDLSDDIARSITEKAKTYLVEQLEGKGIKVNLFSEDQISNQFAKGIKKGQVNLVKGGSFEHGTKRTSKQNSYTAYIANDIVMVRGNTPGNTAFNSGNWMLLAGKIDLIFEPTFYFVEQKARSNSDTHSTNTEAKLSISNGELGNGAGVRFFSPKFKGGTLGLLPHELTYDGTDWMNEMNEQKQLYGNSYNISVNPEAYEKACLELLKAYIDNIVNAIATNLWNS